MKGNLFRMLIPVAAVVAMALVSATSASAAGAPVIGSTEVPAARHELAGAPVVAMVNPNGAATTVYVEYGQKKPEGVEKWERQTAAVGIGAGTTQVKAERQLIALNPHSSFYYRVVANNSYGTTYGEVHKDWTAQFYGNKTGVWSMPEIYSSKGTFKLEQASGPKMTITCKETGHGTIGNAGSVGDEYNIELHSCAVEGLPECKVSPYSSVTPLKPNFEPVYSTEFEMVFSETGCGGIWPSEKFVSKPFELKMGVAEGSYVTVQQPTLVQHTTFGSNPVTITDTAEWWLAGPGLGYKFAWEYF